MEVVGERLAGLLEVEEGSTKRLGAREIESKVKSRGRGFPHTNFACATKDWELIDGIGFRDTGYQRSLPVHESDEYNFSTTTRLARNNGISACLRPVLN
jgi:hypothetical protein